jgi:hypothetical protein
MNIFNKDKIPVFCIDSSMAISSDIFNPNLWSNGSKSIIQSCWSEHAVLQYCSDKIKNMCINAESLCKHHILTLQEQWKISKFPVERMEYYATQPDLHIQIEAYFSGLKKILDFLSQLLVSEKIVGIVIDGFHRDKDIYGGRILNALINNVIKGKEEIASLIYNHINEHKKKWIDQAIFARDLMIHPEKGKLQLMFNLKLKVKKDSLICLNVNPPEIYYKPIQIYTQETINQLTKYSIDFLKHLGINNSVYQKVEMN